MEDHVSALFPSEAIDAFIAEQLEAGQAPGLGISIRRDGEVLLERGYGRADVDTGEPMTERTGVVIGSTTKALTCAALLQLVERGLLDLDAPIRSVIPEFRVADEAASAAMTLRQAVTHTAGLPPSRSEDPGFLFNDDDADDALARSIREVLPTRHLLSAPGGPWVYANDGFVIAGRAIEVLSGGSYEDYMRRRVFAPLGLEDTAFSPTERPELRVAAPHDYDRDGYPYISFFPHNRASAAAGSQLIMPARDAGRWLQALLDGGQGAAGRMLTPESVRELWHPQAVIPAGVRDADGADMHYGLGWMIGARDGVQTCAHGGSTITMGSQFVVVPEQRLAVAVVANSVSELTAIVAAGVIDLLLGRAPRRRFPAVDRALRPDRTLWPHLAGTYRPLIDQNSVPGPLPIEFDGERLRARTYAGDSRRRPGDIFLYPTGDREFVLFGRGRTGGRAQFTVEESGVRATWLGVPLIKIS